MVFSCFWGQKNFKKFFCKRHFMQLFSADARIFLKKFWDFFLSLKTWKNYPQKLLIIGPSAFFFSVADRPKTCRNHIFPLHKNVSLRNFYIMTLSVNLKKYWNCTSRHKPFLRTMISYFKKSMKTEIWKGKNSTSPFRVTCC